MMSTERQYPEMFKVPNGYCPSYSTGVWFPAPVSELPSARWAVHELVLGHTR